MEHISLHARLLPEVGEIVGMIINTGKGQTIAATGTVNEFDEVMIQNEEGRFLGLRGNSSMVMWFELPQIANTQPGFHSFPDVPF